MGVASSLVQWQVVGGDRAARNQSLGGSTLILSPPPLNQRMRAVVLFLTMEVLTSEVLATDRRTTRPVLLDSGIYQGDLKRGVPHGEGTMIYFVNDSEQRVNYTGQLINGTRHGTGRTVWSSGKVYVGEYQYDKENGIGLLRSRSETSEGEFVNGLRHGKGLIVRGEKKMKGVWEEGELVGYLIVVGDRLEVKLPSHVARTGAKVDFEAVPPEEGSGERARMVREYKGQVESKELETRKTIYEAVNPQ